METQSEDNRDRSWVNLPRSIVSLYRNNVISRNEYLTYLHLRATCNPYGICTTSIRDINNDIFGGGVSDSYANKLLLSLKGQKLVWYKRRQGVRGSFEVHFGDFIVPGGKIKTLDKYFDPKLVRSEDASPIPNESEAAPEVDDVSQKLKMQKNELKSTFSWPEKEGQIRGDNNDNYNEKYKNITDRSDDSKFFNKIGNRNLLTEGFCPKTYEEERIWQIAKELGETDMRFLISILHKHSFGLIERAYQEHMETSGKTKVENSPAYLNGIIQRMIKENN